MTQPTPHSSQSLLIFCTMTEGGIAEHTHYQAKAAIRMGVDVTVLAPPGYLRDSRGKPYRVVRRLLPPGVTWRPRVLAKAYFVFATIINQYLLALRILLRSDKRVLIAASSETLALFWAWPHILLRRANVTYAANIHDPRRAMRGRFAWLHGLAIRTGFRPVTIGLLHEDFDREQPHVPVWVECVRAPYGCYEVDRKRANGDRIRRTVESEGARRRVFLAFGHIGDRKNIDLCIRAMQNHPDTALIVAGPPPSGRNRPLSFYSDLVAELGLGDRVRIFGGFVPEDETGDYFDACDALLMSYTRSFVSQSGVLLLAANWGKPILASSGPGPLRRAVEFYRLGVVVEPDSVEELERGIEQMAVVDFDSARWVAFREHASWDRNVGALLTAFDEVEARRGENA